MLSLEATLLTIHITAGTVAMITGFVAAVSTKGGPRHLAAGRVFLWAMLTVEASAVVLLPYRRSAFLASLTVFAGYLTFSGWRALARKSPSQRSAVDLLASLVGLAMAVLLVAVPGFRASGDGPVVWSTAGGTFAYAGYDLWRLTTTSRWSRIPFLWKYEHLVKMMGAWTSSIAAFSGSVLQLFPPPWRQLWPTVVLTPVMLLLLVYHVCRDRRSLGSGDSG